VTSLLAFTLYGPLASWGGIAVGELRDTDVVPSRSALLGLVGAALGIRRGQQRQLEALRANIGVAALVERRGTLLQDYHTAMAPPARFAGRWNLHAEGLKLAHDERGETTILSWRSYRCDALYRVVLWARSASGVSLREIHDALVAPVFALSLGRRSCPLAAPLVPRLLDAESIEEGLRQYFADPAVVLVNRYVSSPASMRDQVGLLLAADADGMFAGPVSMEVTRRDEPLVYRSQRWMYSDRKELRRTMERDQ
jgi:CRISPR system Cascade subunit CasD